MERINENTFGFFIGATTVEAIVEHNWVEFNFYFFNGMWMRRFVSKAGYVSPDEIPEVARNILDKHFTALKTKKGA